MTNCPRVHRPVASGPKDLSICFGTFSALTEWAFLIGLEQTCLSQSQEKPRSLEDLRNVRCKALEKKVSST